MHLSLNILKILNAKGQWLAESCNNNGLLRFNLSIIIQNMIISNSVKEWSSHCRRKVSLLNLAPSNACIHVVIVRKTSHSKTNSTSIEA